MGRGRCGRDGSRAALPHGLQGVERIDTPQPCEVDASGRVSIPVGKIPEPEMFDYVPLAEAQLSAGGGCFVLSEEMEGYYAFRKSG